MVPKQRIEIARANVAVKLKLGYPVTDAEQRLLDTPLTEILRDRRNIVRIRRRLHHRAHNGFERLAPGQLPIGIRCFAEEYALEWALDHELALIEGARGGSSP